MDLARIGIQLLAASVTACTALSLSPLYSSLTSITELRVALLLLLGDSPAPHLVVLVMECPRFHPRAIRNVELDVESGSECVVPIQALDLWIALRA